MPTTIKTRTTCHATRIRFVLIVILYAAGSKDRTARVWQASDGKLVATMNGHGGFVNSLKFTSDGKRLVTASVDGTCRIWETETGNQLEVLHGHVGSATAIDLTNSDQQLTSIGRDQRLRVWDLSASYGGRRAFRVQTDGTYTTTFSPDGQRLYIACYDGHVRVVDTYTGSILADWVAHDASCNTLALSRDGSKLLTCSWDKTAKVWNTTDRNLLRTLEAQDGVYDCAIHGIMNIWDSSTHELKSAISFGDSPINQLSFSADDSRLAVASDAVYLLDANEGESLLRFQPNDDDIYFLAFSPDGARLATCTTSGSIAINETAPLHKRAYGTGLNQDK